MTNIPLPSKQMMEEFALDVGIPDGYVACRVHRDGTVTYLTKEQYEALWQNSQQSGD